MLPKESFLKKKFAKKDLLVLSLIATLLEDVFTMLLFAKFHPDLAHPTNAIQSLINVKL